MIKGGRVLGCPWKLLTIASKLVDFTYLRDVSNLPIKGFINPFPKYQQDIPVETKVRDENKNYVKPPTTSSVSLP